MTKNDLHLLMEELSEIKTALGMNETNHPNKNKDNSIFTELKTKEYEGDRNEP